MTTLRLIGVGFSYGPRDLFRDLTTSLQPGWTGLVGANGSGKSTLLRLLSGELQPDHGRVEGRPALVHHCVQETTPDAADLAELARSSERSAIRLKASFELGVTPSRALSPGELKRWQIAAALYQAPELLLLDEPSNHLDRSSWELLARGLAHYRGIGLLVSHDRELLDRLCHSTLRLHRGELEHNPGSYSEASARWQERAQGQRQEAERKREELKRAERAHQRARQRQQGAASKLSTKRRMKGIKDSDARSSAAKARARNGDARRSQAMRGQRQRVERARERHGAGPRIKERGRSLVLHHEACPYDPVLHMDEGPIYRGDTQVFEELRVSLGREQRVHLQGPNGAGKTTLLRQLYQSAGSKRDKLLYLPQVLPPEDVPTGAVDKISQEEARVLAALGVNPGALECSPSPSPGELRKLAIARGLARGVWAMLLDEPTNHLDLPSIERLQTALADFPGALLLVSHDTVFARALCEESWRVEELGIRAQDSSARRHR